MEGTLEGRIRGIGVIRTSVSVFSSHADDFEEAELPADGRKSGGGGNGKSGGIAAKFVDPDDSVLEEVDAVDPCSATCSCLISRTAFFGTFPSVAFRAQMNVICFTFGFGQFLHCDGFGQVATLHPTFIQLKHLFCNFKRSLLSGTERVHVQVK
jgi:hypothetical protein